VDQKDKRKLENELTVMGLAGLDDPELIEQMAVLVSNWPGDKHEYMRDLLNECDPEKRYEMYHAIAPKLRGFKPLSFPQYEAQIALKAGQMVSQGRMRVEGNRPKPIEVGGTKLAVVSEAEATHAVVTLRCRRCEAGDRFLGETPVDAMYNARKAGWTREPGVNKEICPECTAALAATVVRLSDSHNLAVYDRRSRKLDA
jgi:hypothetical protein